MNTATNTSPWFVSILVAAVVGIGNPALIACSGGGGETEWQFEEEDMASAVAGDFAGMIDDKAVLIHLEQTQGPGASASSPTIPQGLTSRSLQCASRSFIKSAGACIAETNMDVSATITSDAPSLPSGTANGTFSVSGVTLQTGWLSLELASGAAITARFRDGVLEDWALSAADGSTRALALKPVD